MKILKSIESFLDNENNVNFLFLYISFIEEFSLFNIVSIIKLNDITILKASLGNLKLLLLKTIIPLFGLSLKTNP